MNWKKKIAKEWLVVIILGLTLPAIGSITFLIHCASYNSEKRDFLKSYYDHGYDQFNPTAYLLEIDPEYAKKLSEKEKIEGQKWITAREKYEEYEQGLYKPNIQEFLFISLFFIPVAWVLVTLIRITIWSIKTLKSQNERKIANA